MKKEYWKINDLSDFKKVYNSMDYERGESLAKEIKNVHDMASKPTSDVVAFY